MDKFVQLYPLPAKEIPAEGAFLAHNVRQYPEQSGKAFVYSNFIVNILNNLEKPLSIAILSSASTDASPSLTPEARD